jgi:hypothetical protein
VATTQRRYCPAVATGVHEPMEIRWDGPHPTLPEQSVAPSPGMLRLEIVRWTEARLSPEQKQRTIVVRLCANCGLAYCEVKTDEPGEEEPVPVNLPDEDSPAAKARLAELALADDRPAKPRKREPEGV